MSTPKRERQRENRRQRLAASESAAKRYATRRRIKLIGIAAVVVAAALAVLGYLQRDDSSDEVTSPEPAVTDITADLTEDVSVPDPEPAELDEERPTGCPAADGSSPRVIDFDGPSPCASIPRPAMWPSSIRARARCASS